MRKEEREPKRAILNLLKQFVNIKQKQIRRLKEVISNSSRLEPQHRR
jgi:hypothetical protein